MARTARQESESETRRTRIDPKLAEQGWNVVPFDPDRPKARYTHHAVTEFNSPRSRRLRVVRWRSTAGDRRGETCDAWAAERADSGETLLERRRAQPIQLPRLPRSVAAQLARQEGRDYEPASVLLERIRAEREQRQ